MSYWPEWLVIICLVVLAIGSGVNLARADEDPRYREFQKDMLRLSYTEFCANVSEPPNVIREALNNAMAQDPKTWLPAVLWWNKIVDKYKEARCGES